MSRFVGVNFPVQDLRVLHPGKCDLKAIARTDLFKFVATGSGA